MPSGELRLGKNLSPPDARHSINNSARTSEEKQFTLACFRDRILLVNQVIFFLLAREKPYWSNSVHILAKREGLTVIGSAGSDDKVQWLKDELAFDHAFNYKTSNARVELAKFNPLNIYFDNVGGDQLEAALDAADNYARFIECGMIARYNESGEHVIRNLMQMITKRLKMQGFIIMDKANDLSFQKDFYSKVTKWIASGELKVKEDVTKGLERAPQAFAGIFQGKNFGKAVIEIAEW